MSIVPETLHAAIDQLVERAAREAVLVPIKPEDRERYVEEIGSIVMRRLDAALDTEPEIGRMRIDGKDVESALDLVRRGHSIADAAARTLWPKGYSPTLFVRMHAGLVRRIREAMKENKA